MTSAAAAAASKAAFLSEERLSHQTLELDRLRAENLALRQENAAAAAAAHASGLKIAQLNAQIVEVEK